MKVNLLALAGSAARRPPLAARPVHFAARVVDRLVDQRRIRGVGGVLLVSACCLAAGGQDLPDAPSTVVERTSPAGLLDAGIGGDAGRFTSLDAFHADRTRRPACTEAQLSEHRAYLLAGLPGQPAIPAGQPPPVDPACFDQTRREIVVDFKSATRLSSSDKGKLAIRDVIDPFNLITVAGYSAIAIAANSHSAYGPGFGGFGKLLGYSLLQDTQGEFFGTYLIPSLVHQDPRYHRMKNASVPRRVLHALAHTVVTSNDDRSAMPNYGTLLTYPISAELANLYVPGIETDGGSTAKRILIGLATDPAGSLIAEFLPDLAKRVHVRVIFVQEILNQVVTGSPNTL